MGLFLCGAGSPLHSPLPRWPCNGLPPRAEVRSTSRARGGVARLGRAVSGCESARSFRTAFTTGQHMFNVSRSGAWASRISARGWTKLRYLRSSWQKRSTSAPIHAASWHVLIRNSGLTWSGEVLPSSDASTHGLGERAMGGIARRPAEQDGHGTDATGAVNPRTCNQMKTGPETPLGTPATRWHGQVHGEELPVPTRQDEPGAKQWRQTEDAKDLLREPGVSVRELSGYRQGCAELNKALRLAASPETPGNVTARRSALRHALGLFPQSGRDQLSWSIAGGLGRWGGGRLEVCGRRTCGRCHSRPPPNASGAGR
ncbi:hypothetical protein BX257_1298 [Streptomyces sp. 3212.3]|nr:hypothetical protein BX257_1298 [Streptomyces sp. 3212.3]